MSNKATIVAASLSDEELKKSIDNLVKKVDKGATDMALSIDASVELMKKKLAELGDTKINVKVSNDKNVKNTKEETKAINESTEALRNNAAAYDKMAAAEKRAVRKKGIEYTTMQSDVDPTLTYAVNNNKDVDAQLNSILQTEQEIIEAKKKEVRLTQELVEAQSKTNYKGQSYSFDTSVQQMQKDSNALAKKNEELEKNAKTVDSVKRQYTELEAIVDRFVGTSESELLLFTKKSASINSLSESLKKMVAAYQEMSEQERNSADGHKLINNIQKVQRALEQARSKMNRPTNLDSILGFKPKTLDDIEYKLRMLSNYRSGIRFDTAKGKSELEQVSKAIDDLKKKETELLGKNKTLLESNNALARSWNYMKNRLAFYFTVGASTQFVKNIIEIRGQYEMLERSIGILFDSMQKGSQIFAELNAMAIKSPFTTMELGAAAKQLSAYNIKAKDVVDTTRRLADIAAAVGIPIERLTYALGQIKSYGYLNSRDARMFANAGIPLIQNLADMYTKLEGRLVSIGDVYDRIKKKQVSFEDTVDVINEMTNEGGRFFNFQEKAADTLKVKLANLNLAYNNFLNQLGKSEQGMLMGALSTVEGILKNWKSISRAIDTAVVEFGIFKLLQILILKYAKQYTWELTLQTALGKKLGTIITNLGRSVKALAKNPITWIAVALVELTQYITKWYELGEAVEAFNKKISDGSNENIESIDKFYKEYKKDLDSIASMNESDITKMWERIRDEIEKVSKNAQQYISILEKINDKRERTQKADEFLKQERVIQEEVKRLSERGFFDIGGGFMDDSLAEDLIDAEKYMNEMIKKYGDYKTYVASFRKEFQGFYDEARENNYLHNKYELRSEFKSYFKQFDELDIEKIMGVGTAEEKLARIRDAAQLIRDNFFATEEMADAGAESQQRYNRYMDDWIAKQAVANGLIEKDKSNIEARRSAWELFFNQITGKDREMLDYLVKTGKTSSKEFEDIWNKAAEQLEKSSVVAYQAIQNQIEALRATPDIVIDVVYRPTKKKLDDQQQEFEDKWITPQGSGVLSTDEYIQQEKENRQKYSRLNRKDGEDNVEWEKRLGEEYQDNAKAIKSLNAQLSEYDKLSNKQKEDASASMKQKAKERQLYMDLNAVILKVGKSERFNYDQFKKGGKGSKADALAKALSDETKIVNKLSSSYDKLTKAGFSSDDALNEVKKQYSDTIKEINATLRKYGLNTLNVDMFKGKNPNDITKYFEGIKKQLKDGGMANLKRLEPIDAILDSVNVSARTYNINNLMNGLKEELKSVKDEYDLSLELKESPEVGNMFANMFGVDTSDLPNSIDDYIYRIQEKVNTAITSIEINNDVVMQPFDVLKTDLTQWAEQTGVDVNSDLYKGMESAQTQARGSMKKYVSDMAKQTKDLEYKLADINGKILIEEQKKAQLISQLNNAVSDEERKLLKLRVQEQQEAIDKLKEEVLQMLPTYKNLYNSIAEHSAAVTRKLAEQWKQALEGATLTDDGYSVTDPLKNTVSTISEKERGKQLDKVNQKLRETQPIVKKIRESFTKGEDGIIDWVEGVEQIGEEFKKLSELTNTIAAIADFFGNPNEYNETAEALHDISSTMSGISQMTEGFGKFAAGDYIGGAASFVSGAWSAVSAWLDNSNKKIDAEIKSSERAVKRLELAYVDLEHAIDNAYGTAEIGAQRAAIANKQLQLAELKRQLALEQSRKAKDRDDDRIIELQKDIKELQYDIKEATDEIINDLLGISSVGDAMDNLIDNFISALRSGEDAMNVFDDSVNDMIANMVKKMYVTKVLQPWFENAWKTVQNDVEQRSKSFMDWANYVLEGYSTTDAKEAFTKMFSDGSFFQVDPTTWVDFQRTLGTMSEEILSQIDTSSNEAFINSLASIYESGGLTVEDIKRYADVLRDGRDSLGVEMDSLNDYLKELGLMDASKELSSLQQGIQGITEDTAGAIEGYMNGVSQQVYLHSDLLTQIRDTIVGFDFDIQIATMSQILLHLQSSYNVQMSIKSMLEGWSNASGQAVRVELIS